MSDTFFFPTNRQRKIKRKLCFDRQGGKCYYCKKQLQLDYPGFGDYATIEHLERIADGGSWDDENLSVACPRCNKRMGAAIDILTKSIKNIVKELVKVKPH